MSIRSKLSRFVRWFITWPTLVVLAVNVENLATIKGLSNILPQSWGWVVGALTSIYDFATSPGVSYIAVFLMGAIAYEWVSWTARRMDGKNPKAHLMMTRFQALNAATIFRKDGFLRRSKNSRIMLEEINERLAMYSLPLVPEAASSMLSVNQIYATYLDHVASGDFAFARKYLDAMASHERREADKLVGPLSHQLSPGP